MYIFSIIIYICLDLLLTEYFKEVILTYLQNIIEASSKVAQKMETT